MRAPFLLQFFSLLLVVTGTLSASASAAPEAGHPPSSPPSFTRDILPILTKNGCNTAQCHAKATGQNGFRLTVFSYDPAADHREITSEARGRRVVPGAPENSLLLLKATQSVPHEGGRRFEVGSESYTTLVRWIESGMPYQAEKESALESISVNPAQQNYQPGDTRQLAVIANYADGTSRDVTTLADFVSNDKVIAEVGDDGLVTVVSKRPGEGAIACRFMGEVAIARITVPPPTLLPDEAYSALPRNNFIDENAYARFKDFGLLPSPNCSDAEFLRRVSLDLTGVLPTAQESEAFANDVDPEKRRKLIDSLLASPDWADHWAIKWADLLRPNPDRAGVKSVYTLDQWIRASFRANKAFDQFATEVLTARGSTHEFGPAVVFRDRRTPADLTTMMSQIFLGTRLECAKCHHHPNEKWSQADFYSFAAFFGQVKRKGTGLSPPISGSPEFIYHTASGEVRHPVSNQVLPPTELGGKAAVIEGEADPRKALAGWLTRPGNPYFAKAAVNRVWGELFGRGIVHPVDDFRASNPATQAPLLEELAKDFEASNYDLKHLMRRITNSRLYQQSSLPNATNAGDTRYFSRSYRRRLPAEVLNDMVARVTGVPDAYDGLPELVSARETWNFKIPSDFLDAFGRPDSSSDCPNERDLRTSVVQSLHLMHSENLQSKLGSKSGLATTLASSSKTPEQIVRELYLTCYSRQPDEIELEIATGIFSSEGATRETATEDLLWALMNTAEFVFNH